jgi:hypothetical protein
LALGDKGAPGRAGAAGLAAAGLAGLGALSFFVNLEKTTVLDSGKGGRPDNGYRTIQQKLKSAERANPVRQLGAFGCICLLYTPL